MARQADKILNDLERAVFQSVYRSRTQRLRRITAIQILLLKHITGGLLFLWPLYVILLAVLLTPVTSRHLIYLLALLPGLLVWFYIHISGAREDYRQHVRNHILGKGFIKDLFRKS